MKDTNTQLINYLAASIQGLKVEARKMSKRKLNSLLKEAEAHDIKGLIYCGIDNIIDLENLDKTLICSLKREVFSTGITQIAHINQMERVFMEFNNQSISVIALKGLILREFYPRPELRSMCDSDILVRKIDLDKVRRLLLSIGYVESEDVTPAHISFDHKNHLSIEVHWKLADIRYINDMSEFEKGIWDNTITKSIGSSEVFCLCPVDFLIHLCVHMTVHMRSGGFGLRQLCDLVLFTQKENEKIDWELFHKKIKDLGIEKFTIAIFMVCEKLFGLVVPLQLKTATPIDKKYVEILIKDILSNGVYGNRNLHQVFGNNMLNSFSGFKDQSPSKFVSIMSIICPPVNTLSEDYSYAKKFKLLTPIAWVHHFISGIFNKKYSILDKLDFLLFSTSTFRRRSQLIKKLDL